MVFSTIPSGGTPPPPAVPKHILDAFSRHDSDNSGRLEPQELPDALFDCALFIQTDVCRKIVDVYDKYARNAHIDVREFARLVADVHEGEFKPEKKEYQRQGQWDYGHHSRAMPPLKNGEIPVYVKAAFKRYDEDNSGSLDAKELPHAIQDIGFNLNPDKAEHIINLYDDSGDGSFDLKEFAKLIEDLKLGHIRTPKESRQKKLEYLKGPEKRPEPPSFLKQARPDSEHSLAWRVLVAMRHEKVKKAKPASHLDKEYYDTLNALNRLIAMTTEAVNNAKKELAHAEELHRMAKLNWKEKLQYRSGKGKIVEQGFGIPGRDRLVKIAEEQFWRTRKEIDKKQTFLHRAKKDLEEAKRMLAEVEKKAALKAADKQGLENNEHTEGESKAGVAQEEVEKEQAAKNWATAKQAVSAGAAMTALLTPRGGGSGGEEQATGGADGGGGAVMEALDLYEAVGDPAPPRAPTPPPMSARSGGSGMSGENVSAEEAAAAAARGKARRAAIQKGKEYKVRETIVPGEEGSLKGSRGVYQMGSE